MPSCITNSRRDFLTSTLQLSAMTGLMVAGIGNAAAAKTTSAIDTEQSLVNKDNYRLRNVRLEETFIRKNDVITGTQTGLYDLDISAGKIVQIVSAGYSHTHALPTWDAQGKLLLPATQDQHIHLDKTFYGGPWRAPLPRHNVIDMIHQEEQLLPELLPTSEMRAEGLIHLLQSKGSIHARSHCNVDPISRLLGIEHVQQALEKNKAGFTGEIVAFPQHGLLRSNVENMMREAMKIGAHYVGGLDPTNVDGAMEKSLDTMFNLALDFERPIDIHLHETEPHGVRAIEYMIKTVKENPTLQGKVTISHAFALSTLSDKALPAMIENLKHYGFSIATTVPIGKVMMPLPQLRAAGIPVWSGTDTVTDHWQPFGTGSMLEKANIYSQLYRGPDEYSLSRALGIATNEILPLNNQGERQWPKVGDAANMMLVEASCSAEAVARVSPVVTSFYRGRHAFGTLAKA